MKYSHIYETQKQKIKKKEEKKNIRKFVYAFFFIYIEICERSSSIFVVMFNLKEYKFE